MTLDYDDIFECAHFDLTDDLLQKSYIVAYMLNQTIEDEEGNPKVYSPKNFPKKAFAMFIPIDDDNLVEIYFDTAAKAWDSAFVINGTHGKLSPDQMGQFFKSKTYQIII